MISVHIFVCVEGGGGGKKVRIKVLESALLVDRADKQGCYTNYNKENKIDNRIYFKAYMIDTWADE